MVYQEQKIKTLETELTLKTEETMKIISQLKEATKEVEELSRPK